VSILLVDSDSRERGEYLFLQGILAACEEGEEGWLCGLC